jgi:hypothetical protein
MSLLDERFSEIDRQLARKLRNARSSIRHHGIRGDELAGALGTEIRDHIVDCTSFHERCEVQDTHGNVSKEVDLVLLNRFHPTFLLKDRPPAFFIEGVVAAAEVKTSLDKRETIDCLLKAQAFKRLVARVEGKDFEAHNVERPDWFRYLLRRPFFAFAYDDTRSLQAVQDNIEEWVTDNRVPRHEQIDAVFVLNKGIVLNLGAGAGAFEMTDANGALLSGFVRKATSTTFAQLITWLSFVCPNFSSVQPILLKYASFATDGYVK